MSGAKLRKSQLMANFVPLFSPWYRGVSERDHRQIS
jgi:hypothetical protein